MRARWLLAIATGVCGLLLATALAASAQTNVTVSPRDNCGGFNGHVVWTEGSGAYIQLYGEVWDTNCSGSTSVWLAWDSPSYNNVNAETANEPNTEGVNYKTSISADPTNIKVTVCSTNGGWHCGTPVDVATSPPPTTTPPPATPPPTTSPPPTAPVVTTPTSTALPIPTVPHALAVKLTISWTWNRATTRWHAAKIGHFPGRAQIFVQCRGRGCAGKRNLSAHGARNVRRLLRRLRGRRFHAGDRVLIILKAPGYLPERAQIKIRNGGLPQITLLPD